MKVYQELAQAMTGFLNCRKSGNATWRDRHEARLTALIRNCLPHGSGFDSDTTVDFDRSTDERLVFHTSFHHMSGDGFYDGWTSHSVIVRPSFIGGFHVTVTGRNRNDIKDYIGECFHESLSATVHVFADDRISRVAPAMGDAP